jgi:hypothetical protein
MHESGNVYSGRDMLTNSKRRIILFSPPPPPPNVCVCARARACGQRPRELTKTPTISSSLGGGVRQEMLFHSGNK